MASNHTIHALMVGMSENWWRAGIMPCVRSDVETGQTGCLHFLARRRAERADRSRYRIPSGLRRAGMGSREKFYRAARSALGAWDQSG